MIEKENKVEIYFFTPTPFRYKSLSPASNKKISIRLCLCCFVHAQRQMLQITCKVKSKHGPNATVNLKHMYEQYATQIMCTYFNFCNFIRFIHTIRNYRLHLACITPRQKYVFITNFFQSLQIEFIVNICINRYADKYSV